MSVALSCVSVIQKWCLEINLDVPLHFFVERWRVFSICVILSFSQCNSGVLVNRIQSPRCSSKLARLQSLSSLYLRLLIAAHTVFFGFAQARTSWSRRVSITDMFPYNLFCTFSSWQFLKTYKIQTTFPFTMHKGPFLMHVVHLAPCFLLPDN